MVLTAAAIASTYASRYPNRSEESFNLAASAEEPVEIQASAVVGYSATAGPLEWVKALENFGATGQHVLKGDYVQVRENVANWLVSQGRAEIVSEAEVAQAQKAAAAPVKAKS